MRDHIGFVLEGNLERLVGQDLDPPNVLETYAVVILYRERDLV